MSIFTNFKFYQLVIISVYFDFLGSEISANNEKPNFIIILTDDQGWADFSGNKSCKHLKTPSLDKLISSGVNLSNAYATAPQCIPSRVGLLTGKLQNRIGIERNGDPLQAFAEENNLAEIMAANGYNNAMIGKWHLGPPSEIPKHGFRFFYNQVSSAPFWANFSEKGNLTGIQNMRSPKYHIDGCADAALAFIREYAQEPFFLLLSFRAPHVPLDSPKKYISKFSTELPTARRKALGMFAAIDDGIGLITEELSMLNLINKTCVFYLSDNGAPLKLKAQDASHPTLGWNGSYNAPLNGEKGMLTEGGIRIPFAISWPGTIPAGLIYNHPVTSLDIAPTILSLIGIEKNDLDGINLLPFFLGHKKGPPHSFLCWRWIAQTAIRRDSWKYIHCEDREYLFNLEEDIAEKRNVISLFPKIADKLKNQLKIWAKDLKTPGLKNGELPEIWEDYFNYHLGIE